MMGHQLTDNQLLHRQYLESPVWRVKRQEALIFYGCICSRCNEYGNDVHHKTYERVGGNELIEDLEVLCRPCHKAHHRAERASRREKTKRSKSINRQSIFSYLTIPQREKLVIDFKLINVNDLYLKLQHSDNNRLVITAAKMLGFMRFHGKFAPKRGSNYKAGGWQSNDPVRPSVRIPESNGNNVEWISFKEFKKRF